MVPAELEVAIIERERGTFHGWVLLSCSNVGAKARKQLFFLTFAANFHGLSNYGVELLAHNGMLMPLTSYQTMTDNMMLDAREKTRYLLNITSTRIVLQTAVICAALFVQAGQKRSARRLDR